MMGLISNFLSDEWDPESLLSEKKRKQAVDPEAVAQAEGYDPQKPETKASLLSGYLDAPVAPWEKEKAEQGTGEYWAKNLLGINSLFSPSARKAHQGREDKYDEAMRLSRASEQQRLSHLGFNKELVDNFADGDDTNNLQGVLDWQVNTGQKMSFDDLATMDATNPLFANAPGNVASASAQNKYFAAEPFIDNDGNFGFRQFTKDGSDPKVTMLPQGQYPKEWVINAKDRSDLWKDASAEYSTERAAMNSSARALDAVSNVSEEEWSAGVAGDLETFWKTKVTGDTDREQWAKKYAINARNLQQIGLLPPGPATDKDVNIVMKGAPGDNASRKEWVEYLTAVNNLRRISTAVTDSKLDHLGSNQGKMFGMAGFRPDIESIERSVYGDQNSAGSTGPVINENGEAQVDF